ncbi:hypothetical protein [Aeromicrobium sp. HA]|uniref:hypothetical protein n=1 Tax=Aeromicrobium sp. HA TaxID=3009077 RepID=UPI0022AF1069|nr:hypothetical protein [Aeromicrobium sp. HA]
MQPARILFPDVPLWATTYLRAALAARSEAYTSGVHVDTSMPDKRPKRAVICRRDGGPRLDSARESARLAVQVWAGTEQDVNDLTCLVRALIWAAPNGDPVVRVDDSAGPSTIVDESKQPGRYMTFDVIVRGTPL